MNGKSTRRDVLGLVLVVAIALVIRIVYVVQSFDWPYFDNPLSDASLYRDRAVGILGGYWPQPNMAHSQGPLYPYLLAGVLALTDSHKLMLWFQLALGCVSIGLAYWIALRTAGRLAGIVGALLCLGYGPIVAAEGKLLTESLAVLLSLLVVYGLIRQVDSPCWPWAIVVGLLLGAASGLRPSYMLAIPLAGAWLWWRHRRTGLTSLIGPALLYVAGAAAIAPWTYHNYKAEHAFIPISSAGGITFFLGNNPMAVGTLSFGGVITGGVATQNEEQLSRAEAVLGRRLTSAEASTFWYKRAARFILQHPRWWAWIMWRKFRLFFSSFEIANVYSYSTERSVISVLRALAVPFGVIAALGVVGLALSIRRPQVWPIGMLLAVNFATCMVFYTSSRFRMPVAPLAAILAGWGFQQSVSWWRSGHGRRTVLAAAAGMLLIVGMAWPTANPLGSEKLFGQRNLASMFAHGGQPDRGRAILAEQLDPNVPVDDRAEAYLALGRIELDQKRYDDAVRALENALALDPQNFAPYRDLAKANYQLGRYQQAVEHARAMLKHNARDLECRVLIAQCFIKQKRWAQAIPELQAAAELSPSSPPVLYLLGRAYAGAYQYHRAVDALRRSVALKPTPEALVSLALALSKIDEKNEARRILACLLADNPENAEAKVLLRQLGGLRPR